MLAFAGGNLGLWAQDHDSVHEAHAGEHHDGHDHAAHAQSDGANHADAHTHHEEEFVAG